MAKVVEFFDSVGAFLNREAFGLKYYALGLMALGAILIITAIIVFIAVRAKRKNKRANNKVAGEIESKTESSLPADTDDGEIEYIDDYKYNQESEDLAAEKSKAENIPAEKVTKTEKTTDKATTDKVAADKPKAEKATAEKVTKTEKTTTAEKATTDKPKTEKATAKKATTDKVATDKPKAEKTTTEKVTKTEKTTAKKATTEKVAAEKPKAEKAAAEIAAKPSDEENSKGKYFITKSPRGCYFTLAASNGVYVFESDIYSSFTVCRHAIEIFKTYVEKNTFEIKKTDNGEWYYLLKRSNGAYMGKHYSSEAAAKSGIASVQKFYNTDEIRINEAPAKRKS